MTKLTEEIAHIFKQSRLDADRKVWAGKIIAGKISSDEIIELLLMPDKVGMHFSWLMGEIAELSPETIQPSVTRIFQRRKEIPIAHFNRSIAKLFLLCEIPEEIEGEATDALFSWLSDPASDVSTKRFAMLALTQLVKKYPDLKVELKAALNAQIGLNTKNFDKQLLKIIEELAG